MQRKRFDRCKYRCPHPTWSGKREHDPERRHCIYHSPERMAQQQVQKQKLAASAAARRKHPQRPVARIKRLPLVCMFKPYDLVRRDDGSMRAVYQRGICGSAAPYRRRGDSTQPRFPSRFGDPLCETHAHCSHDVYVFPPDPTYDESQHSREDIEERDAHMRKILGPMLR